MHVTRRDPLRNFPRQTTVLHRALLAATLIAGSTAWQAQADDPAAADTSAAANGKLDAVVVTANKREEDAREVPISIGVLSGSQLQDLHVEGYEDISRLIPGVSFSAHNGPGQDDISIRGVSSQVGNPTVGFYIDEVPIITNNGYEGTAQPKMIDVSRVEVLRGPQGTLYGASSEGGTIRFLSNQPSFSEFGLGVRTEISNTQHGSINYDQKFIVNAPISDTFALRIAADLARSSGYIDNYSLAGTLQRKGVNSEEDTNLQVTGKWLASDSLTITPSFYYQKIDASDSPTFIPALGLYNQNKEVSEFDRDTLIIPSLTIKKDFEAVQLTSVTAYVDRKIDRQADGTYFNSAAIAAFVLDPAYPQFQQQNDSILANIASPVLFTDRFQTFTQEFRLASPDKASNGLKWVVGAFYADQRWQHLDYEVAPGFGAAFQGIYGHSVTADPNLDPTGDPNLWNHDLVWTVDDHNEVKQYSGFGQIDFDATRQLHLGVGTRYVTAKESFSEVGGGFFDLGGGGVPPSPPYQQAATFSAWTPKFSAVYDIDADTSAYATAAKGFRLGGATTPNTNVSCVAGLQQLGYTNAPVTYGSDQLWSYEFGLKALSDDQRLSINADVYTINWERIQQTIIIPICGGAFNANVGDARAYGTEVEVRFKPASVKGLTLGLNLGAEHAFITSTINPSTAAIGQSVLFTPEGTASVLADYRWIAADRLQAFVRGSYAYTGSSYGSFQTSSTQYANPAYTTVNLEAGVNAQGLEIAVFAKNLFDDKTVLQRPQINSVIEGYTLRPLTIGISVNKKI